MEAKETDYNGCRFRSRVEARWAMFFDSLGISYQYEPEPFEVCADLWYLPDFWLPDREAWVEIKGAVPTDLEKQKAIGLHRTTGRTVYIFEGFPVVKEFSDPLNSSGYVQEICNFGIFVVSRESPDLCVRQPGHSLSEKMLWILGMWDQDTTAAEYRRNCTRLVDACAAARDRVGDSQHISRVVSKLIEGLRA